MEQFTAQWRLQDLRDQYDGIVGGSYQEIAAILDSPHGPPRPETLLSEHHEDNAWRDTAPARPAAASPSAQRRA